MNKPIYKHYGYFDVEGEKWWDDSSYVDDLKKYCDYLERVNEITKDKVEYWKNETYKLRETINEVIEIKNQYYEVIDRLCLKLEELGVRTTPIGTIATKKDWRDWGFEDVK